MKYVMLVLALCSFAVAYDAKYDSIDVDKILADDKLFHAYADCLLDKGPCEAEYSSEYRRILPEVIATACAKCTPKQAQNIKKSVMALQEKAPEKFKAFEEKYDPNSEYREKFAVFLTKSD